MMGIVVFVIIVGLAIFLSKIMRSRIDERKDDWEHRQKDEGKK
jgi:hypothetical protein